MKLNATQKFILQNAVDSFAEHGVRKPIHCNYTNRAIIDQFNPSYARYNKSMYKLLDEKLIEMRDDGYAYVVNHDRVMETLIHAQ